MTQITKLPIEIIRKLQEYTNIIDFLSIDKYHHNIIKKSVYYWKLTKEFSLKFYTNSDFRETIISKIVCQYY